MDKLNKQLKKGILEIVILKLISKREMYGYEIIKYLEEESNKYYSLKEGSLYPILYRLEDKKLIESFRKDYMEERKIPRKYYRITTLGIAELKQYLDIWNDFLLNTKKILDR